MLAPHTPSAQGPEAAGQIRLEVGDAVVVYVVGEDGWCEGSIVGKRGAPIGRVGLFPIVCLRRSEGEYGDEESIWGGAW